MSLSWFEPTKAVCTSEIVSVSRRGELRTLPIPSLDFYTLRSLCKEYWYFINHRPDLHALDSLFDSLRHSNTRIPSFTSIVCSSIPKPQDEPRSLTDFRTAPDQ